MGLHAAIIRLSPLIHEGEQRYKPYIVGHIVGDPRMVSLSVTPSRPRPPLLKNPGYAPGTTLSNQKFVEAKVFSCCNTS